MVHLMFTDAQIVFSAADIKTVQHLYESFHKFSRSTGLMVNIEKSKMVIGGSTE